MRVGKTAVVDISAILFVCRKPLETSIWAGSLITDDECRTRTARDGSGDLSERKGDQIYMSHMRGSCCTPTARTMAHEGIIRHKPRQ